MPTALRFVRSLALALLVAGTLTRCGEAPTQPDLGDPPPAGKLVVHANVGTTAINGLVIRVSGAGIVKVDGAPDTLSFNITIANGVASGTVTIPAGPSRVITAHAFQGVVETHRGSVTADIAEGVNPQLSLTLVPLVGDVPITIEMGSTLVIVRPGVGSVAVGDTLHLTAEVRDNNGNVVTGAVRWATLNPGRATVSGAGVVTMRDTGEVQIVATYGTVGGSARLTGTGRLSEVAYHLTWNGSVALANSPTYGAWSEPNNWTPHRLGVARVPTALDSVVIPAGARQPRIDICADTFAVNHLVVEAGAGLTTACYGLTVHRSADVRDLVQVPIRALHGARLRGRFATIDARGDSVRLFGRTTAVRVLVNWPGANLRLGGHVLDVSGALDVYDGTLALSDPDTLIVRGDVHWSGGDHQGLLDGGVVHFRGNNFYGYRYRAGGTNRLVFDSAGRQQISGLDAVSAPARAGLQRWEVLTRDTLRICGHVGVQDTLRISGSGTAPLVVHQVGCGGYHVHAAGPVVTTPNTSVQNYLWRLHHATGTSLVAGAWTPSYTEFRAAGALVKPNLGYVHLRFYAANRFTGPTTAQSLTLAGTGVDVAVGGNVVQVTDRLDVDDGAVLAMLESGDSVLVTNQATFSSNGSGVQQPRATAGLLRVGSYFYGFGFGSTGAHVLELAGTSTVGGQYFAGMDHSRPTNDIATMRVTGGSYCVQGHTRVRAMLHLEGTAHVRQGCGGYYLSVHGPLVTASGTTLDSYLVALHDTTGTGHVAGTFAPSHTDIHAAGARVNPALAYVHLRVFQPVRLSGRTQTTGYVHVSGAAAELSPGGHTLAVGDYLQVDNGATIRMQGVLDSLLVANYAAFNDNVHVAQKEKLTAGVMTIGAYLQGYGFAASDTGSHTVVMTGGGAHADRHISGMNYSSRPAQGFRHLAFAAATTYGLCERVRASGTVTVRAGATVQDWCGSPFLRVDGDLVTEAGSVVRPHNVALYNPTGTRNVSTLGTFSPLWTSVHNVLASGELAAGLGYQNLHAHVSMTLAAPMVVNGALHVSGAGTSVTLGGNSLTVAGELDLETGGTITMTNPADSLDVGGLVRWDGAGGHNGKLTAGVVVIRGPTFCSSDYYASGTHTTVFARDPAAGQVRVDCAMNASGLPAGAGSPFRHLDVRGGGALLNCNAYASGNVTVRSGARLDQNCGSGTLSLAGTLVSELGSVITNGPSYPGTQLLTVNMSAITGTSQVNGEFSPHGTVFGGLNAAIKPSLAYRHMWVEKSTSFGGPTTLQGGLTVRSVGTILAMGGNVVSVGGGMNFDDDAVLSMTSAMDTLTIGALDPTADVTWDGGTTSVLTHGVVRFLGDRFYAPYYQAASTHRTVFASDATGAAVSIEGHPTFGKLELAGTRATNINTRATVLDTMFVSVPTQVTGPDYIRLSAGGGGLVTVPGSDVAVHTLYLEDTTGTRDVQGTFRPSRVFFGAPAAASAGAIQPTRAGLAYGSVIVNGGPYHLSGPTVFNGNLTLNGSTAHLNLHGTSLHVTGAVDLQTGSSMAMWGEYGPDSLRVGQWFRINHDAVPSELYAGSIVVEGPHVDLARDDHGITGTRIVMNGGGSEQVVYASGAARALRDLEVTGASNVHLYYHTTLNGSLRVLSPVTVWSGNQLHVKRELSSVTGSTLSFSNGTGLTLDDTLGTMNVQGAYAVTTTVFSGVAGRQYIRPGITYGNIRVGGAALVSGGPLSATGTLTLTNGQVSFSVPSGSTLGGADTYGYLNFEGGSVGSLDLHVRSGGTAVANETGFQSFRSIYLYSGGTLDNLAASPGVSGFRYNGATGVYQNYGGTLSGPAPATY